MDWAGEHHPVERAADVAASAIFAGATAFAVRSTALDFDPGFASAIATALVGVAAFLLAHSGLGRLAADQPYYALDAFDLVPLEPAPENRKAVGELWLTAEMAVSELWLTAEMALSPPCADDVLLLEDRLTDVDADARVVRLFDPRQMYATGMHPPSGARKRGPSRPAPAPSDASQALSDALAELRRSLH